MICRLVAAACVLALMAMPPSSRADTTDCHTIVVPPGLGIGPGADITSFNPLFLTSLYNQQAAWLMFEQLIWINRYHEIDWNRSIAKSITTPDGGRTYNITLRPWKWSDGTPVTSADVLYTYKLIKAYGKNYSGYGAGGIPMLIRSMSAPDAQHIRIVLKRAVNSRWFILNGISQLMPLPEHAWARYSTNEIWERQSDPAFFAVDDGPLKLIKLAVGQYAEFIPNPLYGGGAMHFKHFIIKFVNTEGEELQAVEADELDMGNIPFDLYDKAASLPGMRVVSLPPAYGWQELIPNLANRTSLFFADVRVRQAIADAIDQREIIETAMHGLGVETHNPVPSYPAVFLSPSARAGQFPVGYDPVKAKALLAAAGFSDGPDGILQRNGHRLAFTLKIPAGQPLRIEIAEVIQQNLRAVGIEMKVQQVEFNQLLAEMVSLPQTWQAILVAENLAAYPSGEDLFKTGGYMNNNGYSNRKMDNLIDDSTDQPGLEGLFAYQDYAAEQQPVIFLPNEEYSVLAQKDLHGIKNFMNPLGMWAPEKLYCTTP